MNPLEFIDALKDNLNSISEYKSQILKNVI